MSNPSAVTEVRAWTVRCRRFIVDACHLEARVDADLDVRSTAAAEQALRDAGWTLHGDGTASCPSCLAAWDGTLELLETAIAEDGPTARRVAADAEREELQVAARAIEHVATADAEEGDR